MSSPILGYSWIYVELGVGEGYRLMLIQSQSKQGRSRWLRFPALTAVCELVTNHNWFHKAGHEKARRKRLYMLHILDGTNLLSVDHKYSTKYMHK